MEKLLIDSADNHARELEEMKEAHAKHLRDVSNMSRRMHLYAAERIEYLDKLLGDSANRHSIEIQALKDFHARHGAAHGMHAKDLEA